MGSYIAILGFGLLMAGVLAAFGLAPVALRDIRTQGGDGRIIAILVALMPAVGIGLWIWHRARSADCSARGRQPALSVSCFAAACIAVLLALPAYQETSIASSFHIVLLSLPPLLVSFPPIFLDAQRSVIGWMAAAVGLIALIYLLPYGPLLIPAASLATWGGLRASLSSGQAASAIHPSSKKGGSPREKPDV
jgi:hypothetical protein